MFTSVYRLALVSGFVLPSVALAQDEKKEEKADNAPTEQPTATTEQPSVISKDETLNVPISSENSAPELQKEVPNQPPPEPFAECLAKAKQALAAGQTDEALSLLDEAERLAPTSKSILTPSELSSIWLYRGMVQTFKGIDPLENWRKGLTIHPSHEWQPGLLKPEQEEQSRDIYLALRDEVHNKKIVSLQIPEKHGLAKLYVDGFLRAPNDFVYQGTHLAQIQCPNGDVVGKWTTFEKRHKWIKMCPVKFDVNEEPPKTEEEDEWAAFGDMFGGDSSSPDVNLENEMVPPPLWDRIDKPYFYSAAGGMAGALVTYSAALAGRLAYDDLSNENVNSIDDLDKVRSQTNTLFYTTVGVGTVAVALYAISIKDIRKVKPVPASSLSQENNGSSVRSDAVAQAERNWQLD